MTPEEELGRAEEARFILENELFKESVNTVRNALIDGIERTAFVDEKLREKLCQQLVALTSVMNQIKGHMETGKLAEETLKRRGRTSR